jgi:VanZ family protein
MKKSSIFYGTLLILLAVATLLFCCYPSFHPDQIMGWEYRVWVDSFFHGSYFFLLTISLQKLASPKISSFACALYVVAASTALEVVQLFIPGRSFSLFDMAANLTGILLAYLLPFGWLYITAYRQQREY